MSFAKSSAVNPSQINEVGLKSDSRNYQFFGITDIMCNLKIYMPEIDNNQAASGTADQQPASENSQVDANKSTADDVSGDGVKGLEKKEDPKGDEDKDDGIEPLTRKRLSTQDFIIGRQKARLAKKQAKDASANDTQSKTEEDDDILPEDEALINKVVAKTFAPILDKTLAADDDKEIGEFLQKNPDFKPFEEKARRYIAHPSRRHLPIQSVFYEIAGNKLLKIGADRQRLADEKARNTQTGGGSNREEETGKKIWDMTPAEFEAEKMKVRLSNRT